MANKTRKAEYKRLIEECRRLWNEFDPIGVFDDEDGPDNEYDSYLPHTIKLVQSGADISKLTAYLRSVVHVNIGLGRFPEHRIEAFAQRLHDWRRE